MMGWLRRAFTEALDGWTISRREVVWQKPHGRATPGRNGFGAWFWIHNTSSAYGPGEAWRLTCSPPCPDGRRFCMAHDEVVYRGPDYQEAKRAAQRWANDKWPVTHSVGR